MGKVTKRIQKTQNGSLDASKLAVGGKMPLADGERQALRKLDEVAGQLKISLANVELQIAALTKTKTEVIDALEKQSALMREQAEAVLRSHGGDPKDKDRSWSVNLAEMAIIRIA